MKIVFVGINAKYIHTNPAIRLLNKIVESKYDSTFVEFTIKDNIDHIVDYLKDFDSINFSCYIWNISLVLEVARKIKQLYPNKILAAGGPEVSYEPESFIKDFDYIMCGEGEEIIVPFFDYLNKVTNIIPQGVANKLNPHVEPVYVKNMNNIPSILDCYSEEDRLNKIVYMETTRGCPFKCSYCLSSLENGVRFFDDKYTEEVFEYIRTHKFKCVKFLDRTFNVNPKRFIRICKLLEESNNIYQFEVEPNIFNEDVMEYFTSQVKPGIFRLEIGIQSFNNKTLNSVDRIQKSSEIFDTINKLNNSGTVTVHIDLIAGLPYENLESFKHTFNTAFSLKCEELQLGFLKFLRGTKIRKESDLYDYKFDDKPPYEVISNKFLSTNDVEIIHECENACEWMWNDGRCLNLINHLIKDNEIDNYFDFFADINERIKLVTQIDQKYKSVLDVLRKYNLFKKCYIDDLKLDYLSRNLIKPIPFWIDKDNKTNKKPYSYKELGLDNSYFNSFITTYYDSYLIIKYPKDSKPIIEFIKK